MVVNTIIFLIMALQSGTLLVPDESILLSLGAKDPVGLAHGQVWRLITPMFIHIGFVHFLVNGYTLYIIGWPLERILGGWWFLLTYLLSGLCGNIVSSLFSMSISAGASGAIFGLLGSGFYLEKVLGQKIEKITGQRPRHRVYAMTILLNLGIGLMIPFIDNSAHVGGLIAGVVTTFGMLQLRPNRLQKERRFFGQMVFGAFLILIIVGAYWGSNRDYILSSLRAEIERSEDDRTRIRFLNQALSISPDDAGLRLERARILLMNGEAQYGIVDLRYVLGVPSMVPKLQDLILDLRRSGRATEAWQVQRLLEHGDPL